MTTYYIGPSGSAGNSGLTPSLPKNVAFLNSLTAGDTAILLDGTYNQKVSVEDINGTANNRITIKGQTANGVIISGGWNGVNPPCSSSGVLIIGEYDAMLSFVNCNYLNVEDITINGSTGEAMEFTLCNNCNVRRIKTNISWGAGCITQGASNGGTSENINFYDCYFNKPTQAWKWHRQTVCGQEVDFIQSCFGFFWNAKNCRAERCVVADGGAESLVAGRSSENITFYKCISFNGLHNAAYLATTRNSKFQYCLFYNTAALVATEGRQNGLVFRDEEGALNGGATTSQDNLVEYCIFVNMLNGITWGANATMLRHTVRNCTFINCERPMIIRAPTSTSRRTYPAPVGCVFENNIIYNSAVPGVNTVNQTSGVTWRNNLLFGSSFPTAAQGVGYLTSNPNLANPNITVTAPLDPNNYKIASASSPAIGSGYNNATSTDFFLGTFSSPIDRGAHHYNSSPGTPVDPDPEPDDPGTKPVLVCNNNLLTNHSFSTGATGWAVDTNGVNEIQNGELHVAGTTAYSGTKQVYQINVPLVSGQQYRAVFTGRSAATPVSVVFQSMLHTTPFTNTGLNYSAQLNPVYTQFTTTFVATATNANNRIRITWTDGEFWLDDFCIEPVLTPTIDASFTLSATTINEGESISLTDTSTSTSAITAIDIDWGDGNSTTELDIGRIYDHMYSNYGTYTITMGVTSAAGTDVFSRQLIVLGDIEASFTKTEDSVYAGEVIEFNNTSISSTPITKYMWSFGDGSYSTQTNPKHSYFEAGVYEVTLTVVSADGTDVSQIQRITVKDLIPGPNAIYEILVFDPAQRKVFHLKPSPNPGYVLKQVGTGYAWQLDKE